MRTGLDTIDHFTGKDIVLGELIVAMGGDPHLADSDESDDPSQISLIFSSHPSRLAFQEPTLLDHRIGPRGGRHKRRGTDM